MQEISKRQQVINFVREHSVVRPRDLKELHLPKDYLHILARDGVIEKLGRELYQWPDNELGEFQSLVEVSKLAPKGYSGPHCQDNSVKK